MTQISLHISELLTGGVADTIRRTFLVHDKTKVVFSGFSSVGARLAIVGAGGVQRVDHAFELLARLV